MTPNGHFYNQNTLYGPSVPSPPIDGFESDYFRTSGGAATAIFYVQQNGDNFTVSAAYDGFDTKKHRGDLEKETNVPQEVSV